MWAIVVVLGHDAFAQNSKLKSRIENAQKNTNSNRGEIGCRSCWSGFPTRFATCPPRFALLLDLRKTRRQPTLMTDVLDFEFKTSFPAADMACLL